MKNGKRQLLSIPKEAKSVDGFLQVNGILCPYVGITDNKEKNENTVGELSSWALIQNDLLNVIGAFKLLLEIYSSSQNANFITDDHDPRNITNQSLLFSAIVAYGKCFHNSRGRIVKKIHPEQVYEFDARARKIHSELMNMRDKFVAHGDASPFEDAIVRVALNPDLKNKSILKVYFLTISSAGLHSDQIEDFLYAANVAYRFVEDKINKCFDELRLQMKEIPIETLYENATFADQLSRSK